MDISIALMGILFIITTIITDLMDLADKKIKKLEKKDITPIVFQSMVYFVKIISCLALLVLLSVKVV